MRNVLRFPYRVTRISARSSNRVRRALELTNERAKRCPFCGTLFMCYDVFKEALLRNHPIQRGRSFYDNPYQGFTLNNLPYDCLQRNGSNVRFLEGKLRNWSTCVLFTVLPSGVRNNFIYRLFASYLRKFGIAGGFQSLSIRFHRDFGKGIFSLCVLRGVSGSSGVKLFCWGGGHTHITR